MNTLDLKSFAPKAIAPIVPKAPEGMRLFTVARVNDQSGVSGIGVVAQGVIFASGTVAIQWLTPPPDGDVQIKNNLDKFLDVHVKPHPDNITIITYEDGEVYIHPEFITYDDLKGKTISELNEKIKTHLKQDEITETSN
jgi:hypothetical protein